MKTPVNYNEPIQKLKEQGLITEADKYAFCRFYQKFNLSDFLFALGGMTRTRWSTVDYLIVSDGNTLKVFHVDKKTGEIFKNYASLTKEQIDKLTVRGRYKINIRASLIKMKLDVVSSPKFKKFDQANMQEALMGILKAKFVGKVGKNSAR